MATATFEVSGTITIPAPVVENVEINDGENQRSNIIPLTVTFDRLVSLPATAFSLTNVGTPNAPQSLDGVPMNADHVFGANAADNFFRKYGDADGSGLVDLVDFSTFRSVFSTSEGDPGYLDSLDSDGNLTIDLSDFAAFRSRFGT